MRAVVLALLTSSLGCQKLQNLHWLFISAYDHCIDCFRFLKICWWPVYLWNIWCLLDCLLCLFLEFIRRITDNNFSGKIPDFIGNWTQISKLWAFPLYFYSSRLQACYIVLLIVKINIFMLQGNSRLPFWGSYTF